MDNGFTQLPNCFYKILPVLSESELKVIHVIIAHTIKWHKIMARITYNSFQKESGIYAEAVRKAIVSLQKKNLIIITKKFEYGVNWEYIRDTDEFQLKHASIIEGKTLRLSKQIHFDYRRKTLRKSKTYKDTDLNKEIKIKKILDLPFEDRDLAFNNLSPQEQQEFLAEITKRIYEE